MSAEPVDEGAWLDAIELVLERTRAGEDASSEIAKLPPSWRARVVSLISGYRVLDPPVSTNVASIGPYRVLREIGRGGQAVVHLAEDTRLERRVALKVLHCGANPESDFIERFRREANLASRLDHPGICPIYDVGSDGEVLFIAMRFVEGRTLAARIAEARSAGETTLVQAVEWIEKVALALHAAHERGVVHRDLKPGNIMVAERQDPVILDFGLACDIGIEGPHLTRTGDRLGTPAYMAPEQIDPQRFGPVDRRTDVWGLGVTLYEALSLRRPFEAPTHSALCHAILHEPPRLVTSRSGRALDRDLRVILATALEKDRARRYRDAEVFARDLRAYAEKRPITARRVTAFGRALRWVRREPLKAALTSTAGLAGLAAVAALAYIQGSSAEVRAAREENRLASLRREERQVEERLELGFMRLGEQRFAAAIADFEAVLAQPFDREEALAGWALAHLARKNASAALELLDLNEAAVRANVALGRIRADAWRALGRTQEAEQLEASLPEPHQPIEYFVMGRRAERAYLRGELERVRDAIAWYQRAIFEAPRPRALYFYACAKLAADVDPFVSGEIARALVARWPGDAAAWHHAGVARLVADPRGAADSIRRALELDPSFAPAHVALGRALSATDEPGAMRAFERAVELDPEDYFGWFQLGQEASRSGKPARALEALNRACECAPELVHLRLMLALIQGHEGKLLGAVASVHRAAESDPENSVALLASAALKVAVGDLGDAVSEMRGVFERDPNVPQRVQMLLFDPDREMFGPVIGKLVVPRLERAIEQFPELGFLHSALGFFERVRGDREAALEHSWKGVELDPRFAWGQFENARNLELEGRYAEAERGYREALALDPHYAWAALGIARTLLALGRPRQAISAVREAERLDPLSFRVQLALARAQLALGDSDGALEAYAAALRLRPGYEWSHVELCAALQAKSGSSDIVPALCKTLELSPHSHWVHATIAWLTVRFPGAGAEAVEIAREHAALALEKLGERDDLLRTSAVVCYRAGELEECIETLGRAAEVRGSSAALDELFLAMAHRKLGDEGTARRHWKDALKLIERNAPHDLELARCREEAQELFAAANKD